MALITAIEARNNIKGAVGADDTLLAVLIGYAGPIIASYLGYPPASASAAPTLESATYTRRSGDPGVFLDDEDTTRLYLEPYPITAIASIREDETQVFASSSVVASADYEQRGSRGQIVRLKPLSAHGSFTLDRGSIQIAFTAGYTTVPDALKWATIQYVAYMFGQRTRRGMRSVSEGAMTTAYDAAPLPIPPEVKRLLSPFRLASAYIHA